MSSNLQSFAIVEVEQFDSRVWLALAIAGLRGLAAQSPEARDAIDASLLAALSAGEWAAPLASVRRQIMIDPGQSETARRLEEAIIAKADNLSEPQFPLRASATGR